MSLFSQEPVRIGQISGPVNFDGYPDEEVWEGASKFPLVVSSPNFGAEPSERSEVMIGYDQEYLWVGARLYSRDPDNITSTSKRRDEESRNSDSFGIILDSYDDNENALAFMTMPSGARIDYTVSNDAEGGAGGVGSINRSWNTFWDVETTRDEQGWYVEMRIPFSSLRFQTELGITRMGLIVDRRISYKNEMATYPPIDPRYGFSAYMKPSQAQSIEFEKIQSRNPLYISPYVLGGYSGTNELNEEETVYLHEAKPKLEAGLDVKYSLTSNLTLDLTANTDFAQVEADDQQINLTRYSMFFPEKRLFFQERSGIFNFSLGGRSDNLFYSRRIGLVDDEQVRIYGGARMTGRINKWDVGILDMQTAGYLENPSENFGVARLRRQVINPNSYVGGIMTSRIGTNGDYNMAYGLDGIFRLFGDDYLDVRFAQTFETGAENNVFSSDPTFAGIKWERRTDEGFAYDLSYNFTGEQMNPDMGFLRRNDIQGFNTRLQYGWMYGENSKIFSSRPMFQVQRYSRISDGGLEAMEISPGWFLNTKKGFGTFIELKYLKEGVDEDFELSDEALVPAGEYAFINAQARIFTPSSQPVSAMFSMEAGEFFDGNILSVEASPILNLSSSFQLSGAYQINAISFPDRNQQLRSHIARINVLYMYSTRLSISTFVQLNNGNNAFIGNFRIRYNPREGNDFYLVYNEYRGFMQPGSIPEPPSCYSRALLLKYTHTFRM
ncbi:MAG: DUF5916 domain-containing protein [Bacteroidales bacterium]|nr:DUF5916 domain-containing protein [Bacteroidales bacterium]